MTVRVRFAPSPTGYLHIGGARTALYNYLFAKASGGKFIIRVEDTDESRSSREYEELQIQDLNWLGITYDVGPGKEDEYGPYRQSERLGIYQEYAQKLIDNGLAFYDFCSDEELELAKAKALEENRNPHYEGKWREEKYWDEAKARVAAGEKAPIRFKVDPKDTEFTDLVRGTVTFPADMVGDFVIMRTNGLPTYNFCNVIDDHLHRISHVIRAEEHLNNTVRQLYVYNAFNWTPPQFAHVSLLIGKDRQKLSKRHGATSVHAYKQESYLPEALNNYIMLLGWSHPEERDIFKMADLEKIFNLDRFNKAPAIYDIEKLNYINGQHIKDLEEKDIFLYLEDGLGPNHFFKDQSLEWKRDFIKLYQDKFQTIAELLPQLEKDLLSTELESTDSVQEIKNWETTPQLFELIKSKVDLLLDQNITTDMLDEWMSEAKKLGIKGKQLFKGMRLILTGQDHGPDLKLLVSLTNIDIIKQRLNSFNQ